MSAPTSSPQIVGRGPELAVLGDALDAGRAGHPRAVIVRGEAGIGKTRLLQEFLAEATRRATAAPRLVIATGQCVDLGPIGAPFTPIRRLLHELHGGVGDSVFREAARTPAVVATLSTLLPDLAADADVPPGTADYIAEGIERIIENLSVDHHLLLVIEDLHWADTATLALLKTLAVTLRGKHVTLVMTYRADDVGRQHPLRPVLAEFDRSRAVTGLEVARLTPDDIAVQVRMLTGRDPDPTALDRIAQRSDGVPFFVEELVGLGEAALPETLRDLVLARADRLSPAARRLVGVAAAGGVRVDHALLVAVAGGDPTALDDSIREAIAAGVFVPDGDGYAFRHALIQEAVHDELLVGERLSLHRRYAEELQRRVDTGEPGVAAEAAEQWIAAREDVRAFATTAIAMREARSELAWAAEAALGERLLALWDRVPNPEQVVGSSRMAVAERVMTGLDAIGDAKRLVRIADEALSHGADADPVEGVRVRLISATVRQGLGEDVRPMLLESLDLVEHLDTPAAKAVLSSALALLGGIGFGPHATSSAREELVDRAIVVAEESGDNDALSRALRRRAFAVIESGHWEGLADDLVRAAALASDPVGRGTAITNHSDLLIRLGRYREAIELGLPAWEESVALGVERGVGAFILANVVEAQLALGEAAVGLENARRTQALLPDQLYFFSYIMRAQALTACWDDRPTDADAIVSAHPELVALGASDNDELFGWAHVAIDRALIEAETADAADRGDLVRHALDTAASVMTEEGDEAGALRVPLLASVAWSIRMARTHVPDLDTSDLHSALERAQAALHDEGRDAAMRTLVAAELAGDLAGWRAAVASADLGTTPVRHRHVSRYRLAEALIGSGDREEAVELLERIVAEAPGHGVTVVERWARELATRAGLVIEGMDAAAERRDAASGVSTLTPRELQVLALVAEGLTNPQIGERLFISPKTASVHVSAILSKIGAANRAEAAALYAAAKEPAI